MDEINEAVAVDPARYNIGGYVQGVANDRADVGDMYDVVEIPAPEDAWMDRLTDAMTGVGNAINNAATTAGDIRQAIDRFAEITADAGDATRAFGDLYTEADVTIDAAENRHDPFANIVGAADFLREYDARRMNRATADAMGGWTPNEIADATVRGRRAEMPIWETPFGVAPPQDLMHLEEGIEFQIDGINWEGKEHRKFCGYFSESDMEAMCRHIADDEIAVAYPAGTLVFRYHGDVVAIPEDLYTTRFLIERRIDLLEDRAVVDIHTSAPNINIVWHGNDGTVPTKESLVAMDQAFEEVFQ